MTTISQPTNPTLETLRAELRQRLLDASGTQRFSEVLTERERVLGLTAAVTTMPVDVAEPTETASNETAEEEPTERLDRFGNRILAAPGPLGQYRIQSAREWDKGRILHVCGEAGTTKHLLWWDYDEGEWRMVCGLCFGRKPERAAGQAEQESSDV